VRELKVFIAGPREEKTLDENICVKLRSICDKKYDVLVGDAYGIDSLVQNYLNDIEYKNVKVFASKGLARNNYGNWKIEKVNGEDNLSGFEFYTQKDLEMTKQADIGFMIWNGKSRGTFNNIVNLLNLEKEVVLYYVVNKKFYHFYNMLDLEEFLKNNVKLSSKLKKILPANNNKQFIQMVLF